MNSSKQPNKATLRGLFNLRQASIFASRLTLCYKHAQTCQSLGALCVTTKKPCQATFSPLCTIHCHTSIRWIRMDIQHLLFCRCHIVSISNYVIIFLIKKRTYLYRSAPRKFLRRRRRHVLQTLHLKARCWSLWLLCLEFYSLPRTLALRLRQLRPKVVSGQDPSSLPGRASRLQKVVWTSHNNISYASFCIIHQRLHFICRFWEHFICSIFIGR